MKEKYLYMAVTADKYELPIAVRDTAVDLGKIFGKTANAIVSSICRKRNGRYTGIKFVKVVYIQ